MERKTNHGRFLLVGTLSEAQRQVTHALRHALHLDLFVVRERMVLVSISIISKSNSPAQRGACEQQRQMQPGRTCAVTRACSTIVRASAVRPDIAHPTCTSISMIFSTLSESRSTDCVRFSTARTTPVAVWIPTVVDPSCSVRQCERAGQGGTGAHLDGLDRVLDCSRRQRIQRGQGTDPGTAGPPERRR